LAATRGQPPRGPYAGKSSVIAWRVRPETRAEIERAAKASGRSMSQEVEDRLKGSFAEDKEINDRFGSERSYAVMRLMAATIVAIRPAGAGSADWLNDPVLFDRAVEGIAAVLAQIRPKGRRPSKKSRWKTGGLLGEVAANDLLREVQAAAPAYSSYQSAHQKILTKLKRALGEVADRAEPFGLTAEENRRMAHIARRLGTLRRKIAKHPASVTTGEREEHDRLIGELQASKTPGQRRGKADRGLR
jgi:hypothetical protein